MSYAILPGDVVAYSRAYFREYWPELPDVAIALRRKRGVAVAIDAHPKGDIVQVRWGKRNPRTAPVEARHLRVWRAAPVAPSEPAPVSAMKRGKAKAAIARLPVGGVLIARAYKDAEHPAGHPAPSVYKHAEAFGYMLEVMGYAEHAGKPVAFLRRTA